MAGVFKYKSEDYTGIEDTGGEDIRYMSSSTLLSSELDNMNGDSLFLTHSNSNFSVSFINLLDVNGNELPIDTYAIMVDWSDQSSMISMFGGELGDVLTGGSGDDHLNGGAGTNILKGGPGDDYFYGTAAEMNGDTITDFAAGDKIKITGGDFSSATLNGNALEFGSDYQLTLTGFSGTLSATYQDDPEGGGTIFTLPPVPAPSQPDLAAASDTGSSDSDNNTSNTTPTFTGTGDEGHTVTVFADTNNNQTYDAGTDTLIGTQELSGDSIDYSITAESALDDGNYSIYAVQTDEEGDTSAATDALAVTIDTTAPNLNAEGSDPKNGANPVAVDASIDLVFNEAVTFAAGEIRLVNDDTGDTVETFAPSDVGNAVTGDGTTTLTLNPTQDLPGDTRLRVEIDAGALTDAAGNAISAVGDGAYEFTTEDPDALYTNGTVFNTTDGTRIDNTQKAQNDADNTIIVTDHAHLAGSTIDGRGGNNTVVLTGNEGVDANFTDPATVVQNVSTLEVVSSGVVQVTLNEEKGWNDFTTLKGNGKTSLFVDAETLDFTNKTFSGFNGLASTKPNATMTLSAEQVAMVNNASSEGGVPGWVEAPHIGYIGTEGLTLNIAGATVDASNISLYGVDSLNLTSSGDTTLAVKATAHGPEPIMAVETQTSTMPPAPATLDATTFKTADTDGVDIFQSEGASLDVSRATLINWDTLENTHAGAASTTVSAEQFNNQELKNFRHVDADDEDTLNIRNAIEYQPVSVATTEPNSESSTTADARGKIFTHIDTLAINEMQQVVTAASTSLNTEPSAPIAPPMYMPSQHIRELIVDAAVLSQLDTLRDNSGQGALLSEEADFDISALEVDNFSRVQTTHEGNATITVGADVMVGGFAAVEGYDNTLRTTHTGLNLRSVGLENMQPMAINTLNTAPNEVYVGPPPPFPPITGVQGGQVELENINIITTTNTEGTDFIGAHERSETFVGGAGADTFDSGLGADTLTGGAGNDIFMDVNGDTITDFGKGDIIRVSRMEPKMAINALSTSEPHPNPEPQPELSASEHLLFKNGVLKVDANMDGDFDDTASGLDIAVTLQGLSGGTFSVTNEGGNSDITWTAPAPSSGGGGGGTPTNSRTSKVDGATVNKSTTTTNGRTQEVTEIVPTDETREDDPNTENGSLADVPLAQDEGVDTPALKVGLPTGVGMRAEGAPTRLSKQDALNDLITRIQQKTLENSAPQEEMTGIGQSFLNELPEDSQLFVKTVTPTVAEGAQLGSPITITGAGESQTGNQQEALVIDASSLPSGTVLQLDDVNFAAIVGEAQVIGGTGRNVVTGDDNAQYIVLGEDDDVLYGGGGDDVVGSKGGDDRLFGGSGNDELFGGADADLLHGGNDTDKARYDGNRDDYIVTQEHGVITVQAKNDANDIDKLVNIEILSFADGEESITYDDDLAWITGLYDQVLGRQGDVEGVQYWAKQHAEGLSRADVAMLFMTSSEADQDLNLAVDGTDGVLDTLYQSLLGREADAPGKAYWANELENGSSLRDVAGGFMASEEMRTHDLIDTQWDFIA